MEVADSDSSDAAPDSSALGILAGPDSHGQLDWRALGPGISVYSDSDSPIDLSVIGPATEPDSNGRLDSSAPGISVDPDSDGPLDLSAPGLMAAPDSDDEPVALDRGEGPRQTISIPACVDISPWDHCFHWAHRWWIGLYAVVGERNMCFPRRHLQVSSHFSGLGTVEVALAALRSAALSLSMPPPVARTVFACEIDRQCQHVLRQRVDGACIFRDILEEVSRPQTMQLCVTNGLLDFEAARQMLWAAPVSRAYCVAHSLLCAVPRPDLDVSGSPCTPWSRMVGGTHLRRQHPLAAVLIAWCRVIRALAVPIAIHENVVGFDRVVLEEFLGRDYEIQEVRVSPSDAGFSFIRRPRLYFVLARRGVFAVVRDVAAVYAGVAQRVNPDGFAPNGPSSPSPAWVWQATPEQLFAAENASRRRRGFAPLSVASADWTYLLAPTQQERLAWQERRWRATRGSDPASRPALVIDLSQQPRFCRATEAGLPTFRRQSSSRMWSPARRRWLLPVEQALAMGYPVTQDAAAAAGLPVDTALQARPGAAVGNAMRVANLGSVLLTALACLEPIGAQGSGLG